MSSTSWWYHAWLIWFTATVGLFFVGEIYALCTDWHRTLSAAVWHLESFRTGQPFLQWSAGHFLFAGVLLLLDVWLFGHFVVGLWR